MSKLTDTLHKFAITYRLESKETRKTDLDQAEKQILETHIPKSQLPSEEEIRKICLKNIGYDFELRGVAKAIRELYEKV